MTRGPKFGWLVLGLILLAGCAAAQVRVGENTQLTLAGDVSFGYNGLFGDISSNQMVFGGNFDLTGFYYDPRFLSFRVSPYYNQSRVNSTYNSLFTAKGFNSEANLFSGSHTPVTVSYARDYNDEGLFSVPGEPGYTTNGNAQSFTLGSGLYFKGWPTLQFGFNVGSNDYMLVGSDQGGSGSFHGWSVGSSYSRWGFNFATSYSQDAISQTTPLLVGGPNDVFSQDTHNGSFQASVSRAIGTHANFSTSYSRNHYTTDYTGTQTDQTYDTLNSTVGWRPTQKLYVNGNFNYTTNFGAFLLGTLLPAGTAAPFSASATSGTPDWLTRDSRYLNYGAHATYLLTDSLSFDGGGDYNDENFADILIRTADVNGGVGYHRSLWGGEFASHYGVVFYTSPSNDQTSLGNMASASYSHDVSGWRTTGAFDYSTNVMTAYFGFTQTGYNFSLNGSHKFGGWFLTLGARAGKLKINGLSLADSLSQSYNASFSRNRLSFNGSYSRSGGNSLPSTNGLIPSPLPGPIVVPDLLVTYLGDSYSFGAAYQPVRRMTITSTFSHSLYETAHMQALSNNMYTRLDSRVEYDFRQLHFLATYTYLKQGIGTNFGAPQVVNAVYFGVTRHFNFF